MRPYPHKSIYAMLRNMRLNKKGIALPMVLTYLMIFAFQIAGMSEYVTGVSRQTQMQMNQMRAFYNADTAVEKAVAELHLFIQKNGVVPQDADLTNMKNRQPSLSNIGGALSNYNIAYSGAGWTNKVLTTGDYAGLNGNVRTVNISTTATAPQGRTQTITQSVEIQHIPVFQFGVFYQNDLEILPGATMTFAGPVHSNSSIYLGTHATLNFNSSITSNGNIYHGRKDSSEYMEGNVFIKDKAGVNKNMKNSGTNWEDSNSPDWLMEAVNRWGGNVSSSAHGVSALNLPLPSGSQPHVMVERRSGSDSAAVQNQKLDYKSQIRIIDGVTYNAAGSALELRYCSGGGAYNGSCPGAQTVVNPISNTTFYNFREGKTIKSVDLDVTKLRASPNFVALQNANNGIIIYSSDHRYDGSATNQAAIRLVNASQLPTKGMTVATDNPAYVKGNYNTVSKQPSGIISDSFNILSNAWADANSTNTNLTNKNATATTVNTAVIAGNRETSSGNYNGGFENIHRFLENWTGVNMTFTGSVVVLFNSQYATGNWVYGGNQYTAPNRIWSFDTDFTSPTYNIPGFPSLYTVTKSSWDTN